METTYIEERPIFCTYCGDKEWIPALLPHPCPRCCEKDYKEWKEHDKENDRKELARRMGWTMTLEEVKEKANKLLAELKQAMEEDREITIEGNGYNCSEASGGIKYLVRLINAIDGP